MATEPSSTTTTTTTDATTEPSIPFAPTKASFEKHEIYIRVISPDDTREARVDLNSVCVRTFTILPFLQQMRPRVAAELPALDLVAYDSIEERTYAVHYCNILWQAKVTAKENVPALAETLEDWYDKALESYGLLIRFDLASAEPRGRLQPLTGGYSALTNNLGLVLGVLRSIPPAVLTRTPLDPGDLDQIEHDLLVFQSAWGHRDYTTPVRDDAGVLRSQAFTYLYNAYELARRAAAYFYGAERAEELVPSLFVSLGERKRSAKASGTSESSAGSAPAATSGQSTAFEPNSSQSAQPRVSTSSNTAVSEPFVMDNVAKLPVTQPLDRIK